MALPNCTRCGLCCLLKTCRYGQGYPCKYLRFRNGWQAACILLEKEWIEPERIEIGTGCMHKLRKNYEHLLELYSRAVKLNYHKEFTADERNMHLLSVTP